MKGLILILGMLAALFVATEAKACDYGQLQLSQGYCAPQQQFYAAPVVLRQDARHRNHAQQIVIVEEVRDHRAPQRVRFTRPARRPVRAFQLNIGY